MWPIAPSEEGVFNVIMLIRGIPVGKVSKLTFNFNIGYVLETVCSLICSKDAL